MKLLTLLLKQMMDDVKPVIVMLSFIFVVVPVTLAGVFTTTEGIEFRRNVELFNLVSECRKSAGKNADNVCGPLPKFNSED